MVTSDGWLSHQIFTRGKLNNVKHKHMAWDAEDAVASPTMKNWPLFGQKFQH